MSNHRGLFVMLALTPVLIGGIMYGCVLGVEQIAHNIHYRKALNAIITVNDPCNPKREVGVIYDFPQQAPQDVPPPPRDPQIDGPCSVFHPLENFDDLVQRLLPDPPPDPNPI